MDYSQQDNLTYKVPSSEMKKLFSSDAVKNVILIKWNNWNKYKLWFVQENSYMLELITVT